MLQGHTHERVKVDSAAALQIKCLDYFLLLSSRQMWGRIGGRGGHDFGEGPKELGGGQHAIMVAVVFLWRQRKIERQTRRIVMQHAYIYTLSASYTENHAYPKCGQCPQGVAAELPQNFTARMRYACIDHLSR